MRRHLVGIIGVLLLATGVILLSRYGTGGSKASLMASVCLRAGLVLGALWLAMPQLLSRTPPWFAISLIVAVLVVVWRPQTLVIMGPLIAALAILQFIRWLSKPLPTRQQKKGPPRKQTG